jgi:uncharacterized membrane protein
MAFIATRTETAMSSFALLLERHPLIFVHMLLAIGALVLGGMLLWRRKGDPRHRQLGWIWVVLMGGAALTSVFIEGTKMPHLFGFGPIHLLTLMVLVLLPRAIWFIRQGNVVGHQKTMRGLYKGGCIVAGLFTLMPGRFLGSVLWNNAQALIA